MHRGDLRAREHAEASLREMVAHLNVIDAGIAAIGESTGADVSTAARDFLKRLELLAFLAARVRVSDVPRVTDGLEELVLAAQLQPRHHEDVGDVLRQGVDVLLLLTHDAMRRLHGHPAADLGGAVDVLLERVDRLISARDRKRAPAHIVEGGIF
jgi:hypothetical protein